MEQYEEALALYQDQLLVWERVREVVQKATLEPYAKEIFYAAPLQDQAVKALRGSGRVGRREGISPRLEGS